jgi:hypothetical protein
MLLLTGGRRFEKVWGMARSIREFEESRIVVRLLFVTVDSRIENRGQAVICYC